MDHIQPDTCVMPCSDRTTVESIFRNSQDAIVVTDQERRIVWCNAPFERLIGYRLPELKGQSITRLYAEAEDFDLPSPTALGTEALNGDHSYPMSYVRQDGVVIETETIGWTLQMHDSTPIGHGTVT